MAYGNVKDLNRKTFADKVSRNKAFDIAKDPKYDGYQCGLASVYKFFDKKSSGSGIEHIPNKELAEELCKPIIRNFNKRNVHSPFLTIFGVQILQYATDK